MKLTAILQMYNENSLVYPDNFTNLERYLNSIERYCDALVVYDDGSTDDSLALIESYQEVLREHGAPARLKEIHVIASENNDFANEVGHKARLLEKALEIDSHWIFRIDADEIIEFGGEKKIRELIHRGSEDGIDSFAFKNVNLWRHPSFYRLDNAYNDFISCRLWRNNGNLRYDTVKRGLHQRAVPDGLENEEWADFITIHFGFASDDSILRKYNTYKSHGQSGWELDRLVDERTLTVARSKPSWFGHKIKEGDFNEVFSRPLVAQV